MKKWLLILVCALQAAGLRAESERPEGGASVDERVELLSVVFRLAGADEYSANDAKAYVRDIEQWFGPYRQDTLVRYARRLRNENGIGYDAVAMMAVCLEGEGGRYRLPRNEDTLKELYGGDRWNAFNTAEFVRLLNAFYDRSGFGRFFREHGEWYRRMTDRFALQVNFNRDWYPAFYGTGGEEYRIILGCSNGGNNYGPRIYSDEGKKTAYAVLGCWGFGEEDLADFSGHTPILIHEFNHSFINPLMKLDGNRDRLETAGERIHQALSRVMADQAYGTWPTVINEALVRAAVVRYLRDNGASAVTVAREIYIQENKYFLWTAGLDSLLGVYAAHRDQYPSLRSFYPRIIHFFDSVGTRIDRIVAAYEARRPQVTAIAPFGNGAQDVDPHLTEMTVTFSLPLPDSTLYLTPLNDPRKAHYPSPQVGDFVGGDRHTVRIALRLEPGREYRMSIRPRGRSFVLPGLYPIRPYEVTFKTREK